MPNTDTITAKDVYSIQQGDDEQAIARAQAQIGGKVFRVRADLLSAVESRIEKLHKVADKLGVERVEFRVVEREDVERKVEGETTIYTICWCVLSGKTPMVPGYTFLAKLDHTVQEGEGADAVLISRTPFQTEDLAGIDLSAYSHAKNICDHCGYIRNRNYTYVLVNEDDELIQVGSTCLKDFIGAHNPDKVARWADWLAALDYDLGFEGEDDQLFGGGGGGGRRAFRTLDYLACVATAIRVDGWQKRWEFGERVHGSADTAWNILAPSPQIVKQIREEYGTPTEEDEQLAKDALVWAQSFADNDEISEFENNLIAVTQSKWMPEKGDGILAYSVEGLLRHRGKEIERKAREERKANATPVIEGRIEVTGTVLKLDWKANDFGERHVMTVLDDRGFTVWGTVPASIDGFNPVEVGSRVSFTGTIKKSDDDETFGFFTRPAKAVKL